MIAAQVFNGNRNPRRGSPATATDFILRSKAEKAEQETDQAIAWLFANSKKAE